MGAWVNARNVQTSAIDYANSIGVRIKQLEYERDLLRAHDKNKKFEQPYRDNVEQYKLLCFDAQEKLKNAQVELYCKQNEIAGLKNPNITSNEEKWTPDSFAMCEKCAKKLGDGYRQPRRHHCRFCFKLVCGDCSQNSRKVTSNGKTTKHRICKTCNTEIPEKIRIAEKVLPSLINIVEKQKAIVALHRELLESSQNTFNSWQRSFNGIKEALRQCNKLQHTRKMLGGVKARCDQIDAEIKVLKKRIPPTSYDRKSIPQKVEELCDNKQRHTEKVASLLPNQRKRGSKLQPVQNTASPPPVDTRPPMAGDDPEEKRDFTPKSAEIPPEQDLTHPKVAPGPEVAKRRTRKRRSRKAPPLGLLKCKPTSVPNVAGPQRAKKTGPHEAGSETLNAYAIRTQEPPSPKRAPGSVPCPGLA